MTDTTQTKTDLCYTIEFNLTHRIMYVHLSSDPVVESHTSEDSTSVVDTCISPSGNMQVVGVEIFDDNKFTLIQDWIEQAIENALPVGYEDNYEHGYVEVDHAATIMAHCYGQG